MTPDQARELHDKKLLKGWKCCRHPDLREILWCSEYSRICPPEMCNYEGKDGSKCEFQVHKIECQNCKHSQED